MDRKPTRKPNKYRGACCHCGAMVAARAGVCWRPRGARRFLVAHLACSDEQFEVVTYRTSSGWTGTQNRRGRCEDAPCCGCCTC